MSVIIIDDDDERPIKKHKALVIESRGEPTFHEADIYKWRDRWLPFGFDATRHLNEYWTVSLCCTRNFVDRSLRAILQTRYNDTLIQEKIVTKIADLNKCFMRMIRFCRFKYHPILNDVRLPQENVWSCFQLDSLEMMAHIKECEQRHCEELKSLREVSYECDLDFEKIADELSK
jgi:hypothetical protein